MAPSPQTIGEFSVLPISIPPVPSFPRNVVHYLYVRRNTPKIPTANDSRSLFLANVPVDSTELHLRALFASLVGAGRFESASFEDERKEAEAVAAALDAAPAQAVRLLAAHGKKRKREDQEAAERAEEEAAARLPSTWTRPLRKSGSTAVVLLADEKSVHQVLKAIAKVHKSKKYPTWGGEGNVVAERVPQLGSIWLKAHNQLSYPDRDQLQAAVDAFSTMFARREREAAEIAKRLRNEPDEDGFVTVTRGGRSAPATRNEAEEAKKKMIEKAEKKKQEMTDFYRFQMRERKKAEQEELVKRFEEDRQKLDAMRQKRGKFVPEA
ncbi:ribosomal RNA-processing protein 7-domain-containing protein [Neurospora hispaniola]|uniref:Ribosomal RNA-processing protein 7-domain-containing protein n=1 Tax=Neurospora hispaniola TaxID=588809 RepID=A0AAJ0IF94_9PEZI|nr:ribosomal RNA-processing protein 7-domain-containing protein [Neurospora hispaniola]